MNIKKSSVNELETYLIEKNWISTNEKVLHKMSAGDGNMNCVLRIQTNLNSFICKQSNDFVEKYPHIFAPKNRVQTEALFYKKIKINPKIQKMMPEMFGIDIENNIMFLEDLGDINDYSSLYTLQNKISNDELKSLTSYLNELHQSFVKSDGDFELSNIAMRKLNHEHIFEFPFLEDNGFDLDVIQNGLQQLAVPFKTDNVLKEAIKELSNRYLENGKYLLHGDFYPASWLNCGGEIKIIDPEFCYYGHREFDLGVFIAHLYLSNQQNEAIEFVKKCYIDFDTLNHKLLNGFIGIEILRRLIGLAQLPLKMNLELKNNLLKKAQKLILN